MTVAKRWAGLNKLAEECAELCVELMKLLEFPSGKHPGRKRNLKLTTEEEIADVYAALDYFVAKHAFDQGKIQRRRKLKVQKFIKWWGLPEVTALPTAAPKPKSVKKKTDAKKA